MININFKHFYGELTRLSAKNKERLIELYTDYNKSNDEVFYENKLFKFTIEGVKHHFEELMNFIIYIPKNKIYDEIIKISLPIEDYLLRHFYESISSWSDSIFNKNKEKRDQFIVFIQETSQIVAKRNGVIYDNNIECFLIKLVVQIPLMSGGKRIDGKKAIMCFKKLFSIIERLILNINKNELIKSIVLYDNQQQIRDFLIKNEFVCFIGNGSILPRNEDSDKKNINSIPFLSPKENEITIELKNGEKISGMGIKKGICVIIGDGYSGKSTLINAIESGIYNHCLNDGREYILTDTTAIMCNSEEGRSINKADMSFFFKRLPGESLVSSYCSNHASGSVSQSCNILEALNLKSNLILIDEDKSAVNFMYKDEAMKKIIPNSSIVTLMERLTTLKEITSFIIVVGSLSDFMKYADTIIVMKDFKAEILHYELKATDGLKVIPIKQEKIVNCKSRFFFNIDVIDNKMFIYDDLFIDISSITSIISKHQISFLQYAVKLCLSYSKQESIPLFSLASNAKSYILNKECISITNIINENTSMFFEDVRNIDIQLALLRLKNKGQLDINLFK